ncbi:MAG: hypothetical protein OEY59_10695 [Deltaproteobacteria bacterium]|nr:hypothetical protein [Deltaproteobacteria bacterium]
MKGIKTIFITLAGLIFVAGCSSQAKVTHAVFAKPNITFEKLNSSLNELRSDAKSGSTLDQYKIVKALRHISKYFKDPGKRELAIRGLAYLAAFSSDSDVVESCNSRLNAILTNKDEDYAIRLAVIRAKEDVVTGKIGYSYIDSSFFSSAKTQKFEVADEDEREEALEDLIDYFSDLPFDLQYQMVKSFERILTNPPVCVDYDAQKCNKTDEKDQREWKNELWAEITDWLEDENINQTLKTSFIMIALDSKALKGNNPEATWIAHWANEGILNDAVKANVLAAQNHLNEVYPGITKEVQSEQALDFIASVEYLDLTKFLENPFWVNNINKILELQLFNPSFTIDNLESKLRHVPYDWVSYTFDESNWTSYELRNVINRNIAKYLRKDFLITNPDKLTEELVPKIETAASTSMNALEQTLELTSLSFPTLSQAKKDALPILDSLERGYRENRSLFLQRLYLNAMLDGTFFYKDQVESKICPILSEVDVYTSHMLKLRAYRSLAMFEPASSPDSTSDQPATETAEEGAESAEGSHYYFCGEDLVRVSQIVAQPFIPSLYAQAEETPPIDTEVPSSEDQPDLSPEEPASTEPEY